jgi:Domain of unknown function (DUF4262)
MCWECDHPEAGHQGYIEHLRGMIDQYGWAVQGVGPDRIHPPWAYTVGLTAHGRPELAVTGMSITDAAGLLNDVAAHCMHAAVPEPGEQVPLIGGPIIEFVEINVPTAHLLVAVELFGPLIRALQVVHADDTGRWPWDRRYRGGPGGQPVLGRRSAAAMATAPAIVTAAAPGAATAKATVTAAVPGTARAMATAAGTARSGSTAASRTRAVP